jgi:Ca2+-dependent lipid-binding protein
MSDSLRVRVVSAKFNEKQDILGQGDPYVTLTFGSQKVKTAVVHNSRTGVFNQGFFVLYDLYLRFLIDFHFSFDGKPGAIQVDLWDEDSLLKSDKDDLVGINIIFFSLIFCYRICKIGKFRSI